MSATVESLRYWSHLLMWVSIIVPIVGALIGAAAGVARYYVDRYEKKATAEIHRTELERSKREIDDLKKVTAPRSLAPEAESRLVKGLLPEQGRVVVLVSRLMDGESDDYARQIGAAFEKAKWKAVFNRTSLNDHRGVVVACHTTTKEPLPGYDRLVSVLKDAGIEISQGPLRENAVSGELPAESFLLVVGRR